MMQRQTRSYSIAAEVLAIGNGIMVESPAANEKGDRAP